jgi:Leucine-rich repeat (LRR) protein
MFAVRQIQVLDLSDNPGLTQIPNEIEQLTQLRTLRFNNNGLQSLPLGILNLADLDTLELNKNKLATFYPN